MQRSGKEAIRTSTKIQLSKPKREITYIKILITLEPHGIFRSQFAYL